MKRLVCLALALALLASVLAACGKLTQNPPDWSTSTGSSQAAKPSEKSTKPSTPTKSEPRESSAETQEPSTQGTSPASSDAARPTADNPQPTEPNTTQPTEPPATKPADTGVTARMENALKAAKQYLSFTNFSYAGLISQLEYEKYTTEEATYAADHCGGLAAARPAQDQLQHGHISSPLFSISIVA